ncbi:hypothetical protein M569_09254, partial [Genlisea aurea]
KPRLLFSILFVMIFSLLISSPESRKLPGVSTPNEGFFVEKFPMGRRGNEEKPDVHRVPFDDRNLRSVPSPGIGH